MEILLPLRAIQDAEATTLRGQATGLVVRDDEDAEVWLWVKGPTSKGLIDRLVEVS